MSNAPAEPTDTASAYLAALKGYSTSRLQAVLRNLEAPESVSRDLTLSGQIVERLNDREVLGRLMAALPPESVLALRLFSGLDKFRLPASGVLYGAALLGTDAAEALSPLLETGLVAMLSAETELPEFTEVFRDGRPPEGLEFRVHPEVREHVPPVLPEGVPPETAEVDSQVEGIREADGLEPVLRLAALWQRASEGPFRQTQTGALYKRDRDRLVEDAVLAGPIADVVEPLPDMPWLWLGLARATGLVVENESGEAVEAAGPEFWGEHAVHLPQMIAQGWLGLELWHEQAGGRDGGSGHRLAAPFLRLAALMWLARQPEDGWTGLDELARFFRDRDPWWDRLTLGLPVASPGGNLGSPRGNSGPPGGNSRGRWETGETLGKGLLDSVLLGPAYQLGLVSVAEDREGGRRLVRITPLGRYVLGLGPPPPPRETFDQFLYVQPNYEIIAYRQGLNPWLVGLFSRFLEWKQLGAALELRLTPEWVYRGLEGGLSTEKMLQRLERHGGRALPSSVAEAFKSWSARRERVVVHTAATLVEFGSPEDLAEALRTWPGGEGSVTRLTDRIVLANDPAAIPFDRFRISGSRDYRQPPEPCLEVGPDGVTVSLELGRSDLFINAELARLSDEEGWEGPSSTRRWYVLSKASLARALDEGQTPEQIERWFQNRSGAPMPPSARLLLRAARGEKEPVRASRMTVLRVPHAEMLDGLFQHPLTAPWMGERLGPECVEISETAREPLGKALGDLGLRFEME